MKLLPIILLSLACLTSFAQDARKEIKKNVLLSGSNYVAYYGPQKKLTKAPKGYEPYYISHYGRHGSRFLIGMGDYDFACNTLSQAEKKGYLTAKGKETLQKVMAIREEARGRDGELTPLGAQQHHEIAARMYKRFPKVFKGKTNIDAKSTNVVRCILSMENELHELLAHNAKLHITHDGSVHDLWYMNYHDQKLYDMKFPREVKAKYDAYCEPRNHPERLMRLLFNNEEYVHKNVNAQQLMDCLWKLASNIQSTELRRTISLYDLFNEQEIYDQWEKQNAYWYITYAGSPWSGAVQQFSQRNLLRQMIQEADSCLKMKHPGATLRFGHEVCVMPLVALLDLNGYGAAYDNLDDLVKHGWFNYRIYPMACNVQFVFYRDKTGEDIIFKVLLNEDEATLPIPPANGCYYRWSDFREYFTKKMKDYENSQHH